jgi:outer membrane protein assembly factor BamE (lipoprotein component of BamABCDE complex)
MKSQKLKWIVLGSALALLNGCATMSGAESKENLAKLKYGMDTKEVVSLLGNPDSVMLQGKNDSRWIYEFKSHDKKGRNLFVDFKNGELARTGELSGRDVAAAGDAENRESGVCTHRVHPEMQTEPLCLR